MLVECLHFDQFASTEGEDQEPPSEYDSQNPRQYDMWHGPAAGETMR
jgi:hypothetical protein